MTSTYVALILGLVVILAVVGITLLFLQASDALPSFRRLPIRHTVLVVLEHGTIRGTMLRHTRRLLVLGSAELLRAGDQPATPIDGTVYLDPRSVRWIQSPKE